MGEAGFRVHPILGRGQALCQLPKVVATTQHPADAGGYCFPACGRGYGYSASVTVASPTRTVSQRCFPNAVGYNQHYRKISK